MNPEELSTQELVRLVRLLSRNWLTLDGNWFDLVERRFGLQVALELDVQMWRRQARIEARRIQREFLEGLRGLEAVLRAMGLMSWAFADVDYVVERQEGSALVTFRRCHPQEARRRAGKGEFPCREAGRAWREALCEVLAPELKVVCHFCPPGPHPEEAWCRWEFRTG